MAASTRSNIFSIAATVFLALSLVPGLVLGQALSPAATTFPSLQKQSPSNFVLNGLVGQPPQTRVFYFNVGQVQGAPDGVSRPMLAVNGIYPGPTIEANQHDRLVIHVKNNLPNATSIHWHGLFQNGTNFFDGSAGITQCGIPPGQSLTYNFTLGDFSGTTWWHALATQYTDGISGPLIVHPTAPNPPNFPTWDEELVVQMADWYHNMSGALGAVYLSTTGINNTPGDEPVPDAGTLNGLGQYFTSGTGGSFFNFTLQRNKTYRIRLANSGSFAGFRFSVDNHPLQLIEAEGTLLAPTMVAGVTVEVAQRYSVLLRTNATASPNGTYWMRATMQTAMFTYTQPGQNLDIRGVIRYDDAPSTGLPSALGSPDPGPGVANLPDVDGFSTLIPAVKDIAPDATRAIPLTILFQNNAAGINIAFINNVSWVPLVTDATLLEVQRNPSFAPVGQSVQNAGTQLVITEDSIQTLDIQLNNQDTGNHPFHLHGHKPWIMGTGTGIYSGTPLDNTNPLRRDTVLIPAGGWVVLRFVTDNPGLWAFHCHLAWHMEAGLLAQFNSLPSKTAQMEIPEAIVEQCAAR